jgi:hypothetical protein
LKGAGGQTKFRLKQLSGFAPWRAKTWLEVAKPAFKADAAGVLKRFTIVLHRMPRTKRDSVLPPVRLHKAELERLKSQANQWDMTFSAYLRLKLLHPGKLRRVSTRGREEGEKRSRENGGRVPPGEKLASNRGYGTIWCSHGYPSFANGVTYCPVCRVLGPQIRH